MENKQSREDRIKQKAIDAARKAGTLPPAVDKSGKMINPHIPEYMSKAPWYLPQDATDGLQHQRKEEESFDDIDKTYKKGVIVNSSVKYRKGACKNCGSMTHKEKDCFYPTRKKGAWKTNSGIMPDELIQPELKLSYEGKRDRWSGSNAEALAEQRRAFMEQVDSERLKAKNEQLLNQFQTEPDKDHMRYTSGIIEHKEVERPKLVDNENNDSHVKDKVTQANITNLDVNLDFGDDEDLLSPTEEVNDPNMPLAERQAEEEKQKRRRDVENSFKKVSEYDFKNKVICVGSMRLRSDTAKYLFNLDLDSAHFDPKTRSMRMNPFEGSGKAPEDVPFAGENFLLSSGDIQDFRKAQVFAWESHKSGVDINIAANPTATEMMKKQTEERMQEAAETTRSSLESRYGKQPQVSDAFSQVKATENYVEYNKEGKLVKGLPEAIPKSMYEEDFFPGNHTSVWGSWYDQSSRKWGYSCCKSTIRNAYCVGGSSV